MNKSNIIWTHSQKGLFKMNQTCHKRLSYLTQIVLSTSFELKNYKTLNNSVKFSELKDVIGMCLLSKDIQIRNVAIKRYKEISKLYPLDIYPEKWI